MPNRNIKESICTSKTIDLLTAEEERLFYRLIVQCDDYGRMESHAQLVKSKCFPWKDALSQDEVESWLQGLHRSGAIVLYEVDDKRYLELTGWSKYQRVRATVSKYPAPADGVIQPAEDCGNSPQLADNRCQLHALTDTVTGTVYRIPIPYTESGDESSSKLSQKKAKPVKKRYGEFNNVLLTEQEYEKLRVKFGDTGVEEKIKYFSETIESKGYKYKSHYATILTWDRRDTAGGNGNGKYQNDNRTSRTERIRSSVYRPL